MSDYTPVSQVTAPLTDPRPDLVGDSLAWTRLLELASTVEPDTFVGTLYGIRCCGHGWYMTGVGGSSRPSTPTERIALWHTSEAWERDRGTWLVPYGPPAPPLPPTDASVAQVVATGA